VAELAAGGAVAEGAMSGEAVLDGLLAEHDSWLRVERGLAPNSLAAYRRDLRRYADYLRRRGFTGDVASLDEGVVAGFVEELQRPSVARDVKLIARSLLERAPPVGPDLGRNVEVSKKRERAARGR